LFLFLVDDDDLGCQLFQPSLVLLGRLETQLLPCLVRQLEPNEAPEEEAGADAGAGFGREVAVGSVS